MSTRSSIAYKDKDGIHNIYCHFDGYPEKPGVGYKLTKYYNNEQAAREIISLGDASCIEEKLYPTTNNHSFDHPEEGVSVFYCRDRGASLESCKEKIHKNLKEWMTEYSDADYFYLWDNNKWNCWDFKGAKIALYE